MFIFKHPSFDGREYDFCLIIVVFYLICTFFCVCFFCSAGCACKSVITIFTPSSFPQEVQSVKNVSQCNLKHFESTSALKNTKTKLLWLCFSL